MNKRDVFKTIANQVAQSELVFSTGAQVALKSHHALDDPDCSVDTAAKLIQAEPLLSARVIAIANSVAYNRSGQDITDIRVAISRLGFTTVRTLAMALVARQMAGKPSDPNLLELINLLWQHTAHVASLANVIARHVTRQNPETAMFAGIIHEIGGFYLISRAAEFPGLLDHDFTDWLEYGEVEVGHVVLAKLGIPESVETVMAEFWEGFIAMPPVTLADTLLLAEMLSPVPSPLHQLESVEGHNAMTAQIELVIGEETLSLIMKEAATEVNSLTRALQF
jgi:HD-like signal output (HDOD) protein